MAARARHVPSASAAERFAGELTITGWRAVLRARRNIASDAELIGRSLAGDGEAFMEVIGRRHDTESGRTNRHQPGAVRPRPRLSFLSPLRPTGSMITELLRAYSPQNYHDNQNYRDHGSSEDNRRRNAPARTAGRPLNLRPSLQTQCAAPSGQDQFRVGRIRPRPPLRRCSPRSVLDSTGSSSH
jgi:hypothetical protein